MWRKEGQCYWDESEGEDAAISYGRYGEDDPAVLPLDLVTRHMQQ